MPKLHAIDYLAQPDKYPPKAVCVAYGDDLFLRRQVLRRVRDAVLKGDEGDLSLSTFEGRAAVFRDVVEELTTIAMFGGQRLVVVENADEGAKNKARTAESADNSGTDELDLAEPTSGFIARYRQQLEDYVARPGRNGVLLLDVRSWPSNTKLYKAVDAHGLAVDCNVPEKPRELVPFLKSWIASWARQTHKIQIPPDAVAVLIELVEPELGLLDQELAKLALVADEKKITPELVHKTVGTWKAKTVWDMLDFALDGKANEALKQIDRLMTSGEAPLAVLARISVSLRRFATATRLIVRSEARGNKVNVRAALQSVGVKNFSIDGVNILDKAERQLRRLGRQRGGQLYRWLLETDLDLKGDSPMPPRLVLERLIVRLAAPA